jgi:antitoxin component YwqK of YwqJK toxin-antitoxin module
MKALIQDKARQGIARKHPNGKKELVYYYLSGEKVGYRKWDEEGRLYLEGALKNGIDHGPFRQFHDNGRVSWEGSSKNGKRHGVARQYDENGFLIGKSHWRNGTGMDLWYHEKGFISEERYVVDGSWNGFERWWNGDQKTVWSETHFKDDLQHGVRREWNSQGKLKRDFPQYFVNGNKVTKRQYLSACKTDLSLPVFREADNIPTRTLPQGVA